MRVLAAMSGGVDSAVAAARAVAAGHDVTGVHLALSQNPATLRHVMGKTSRRLSPRQIASRRAMPSALGAPAKYAPLMAPADDPTTMSGTTPNATNSWSIPTCTAPKLPPPARTNAVRGVPLPVDIDSFYTAIASPRLPIFNLL